MPTIDNLQIDINAQATRANDAVDRLVEKLDRLTTSLSRVEGSKLTGLANGVQKLGNAMQTMGNVKTTEFSRLARNLKNLSTIDTAAINRASSSVTLIAKSFRGLNGLSKSAEQLGQLANGIKQLGYKSAGQAIDNIPKLAAAMRQLMNELSKAPRVSQNLIDMTNALAKLSRTGASSGRAANSIAKSLDTYTASTHRASKGSFSLASTIGKVYASYWLLFRAFGGIRKAIDISSDLTEVQNVVDVTFGDMSSKVDEFAQNSIQNLGMSELSVKSFASRFQAMGMAMGIDPSLIGSANKYLSGVTDGYVGLSDSMADVSLNLTKLTADMASFYNVEQAVAAEDLAAIFTGETRPLRDYGIDLTQATLAEWAMKQGMDANIQSMSQAEKTMLRYQYVMANTGAAQRDFIRTQDTWANQVRILKEQIRQLASVIGGVFINALKPLVKALNVAMSYIIEFAKTISNALGKIFGWQYEVGGGGMTQDFAGAAGSAEDIADSTGQAADNIKKMQAGLRAFDELKVINMPEAGGGNGGAGGGGGGAAGGGASGGQWVKGESMLENFESEIDTLFELGEYIGKTLTDAMNSIDWKKVYEGAKNFGKGLAEFLNGLISPDLFGAVGKTIAGALNTAIYAALSFGETFEFEEFGLSIAEGINQFFETFDFASLAQTINVWVQGIWSTIKTALANINWKNVLKGFYEFFDELDFLPKTIIALKTLPKLLKAITSNKILKGFINIAKALSGNRAAIDSLIISYPKLGKAVNVARKAFANFQFGISNGNIFTGLNEGITTIRNNLTNLQKGAITAVAGFAEFKIVSDVFEGIVDGSENVTSGLTKIGAAVAAAGAAMYVALGPAGIAIAAITGTVAAIKGINDALNELQLNSMFDAIKSNGVTSLEALGNVANSAFGEITKGIDATKEKIDSISQTKENIDETVESIANIRNAIDNGAYSVSEKVPIIIEQFQDLLNNSKSVLEEEYDVIVGNIVGAWADVLTAQGKSIPEVVSGLLDMTEQGKAAYADLELSLNSLIDQYNNGEMSAEEFYAQSEPLFKKLSELNADGSIDNAVTSIQNLGGALDLSQYITDGAFDTTAFQSYMETVVQTAEDGKNNLETLKEENKATLDAYKQQLESLGIDTSNFDWAALYGASETQVAQGISDISAAYQDYADQVQYALLEQLPTVVEDATSGYEELKWWQKLFTTKEDYVQGEIDKWKQNILSPAMSTLQTGFEDLGIDGEVWAGSAAEKMSDSLFDTFTTSLSDGTPVAVDTLKNNWNEILTTALSGAAEAVDAESYGKDTVEGYMEGVENNVDSSKAKIQEWMEELDNAIHDSSMDFGSPSKKAEEYGLWTIEGFNEGILNNTSKTMEIINTYMTSIKQTFSQITTSFLQIGIDAMNGLNNGLSSMEWTLYSKAREIANNITKTIKTALDIHSPSRVMFELGDYTMQGFRDGLENLYQPILYSVKDFSYDLQVAPAPSIESMYSGYQYQTNTYTPQYDMAEYSRNNYNQSNTETNALLRQQNELLEEILKKPTLNNSDVFNAAKSVYKGEATRRYGNSAAFDPVWG